MTASSLPIPDAPSTAHIADRYPLSPMQVGMLFHALATPGGGVDIEQLVCAFDEPLDSRALQAAWEAVARRHAVLRTAFRWEGAPVQEVRTACEISWAEEDLRETAREAGQARFAAFLAEDRRRGFAMDEAPLWRLTLFRLPGGNARLVWTFHHALLDGRSLAIVLREVFAIHDAARAGQPLDLPAPRPYREFIDWLGAQQPSASEAFWREQLRGFTAPTPLAVDHLPRDPNAPRRPDPTAKLDAATTSTLAALAGAHSFTLNTLVQAAWALLLSRYSGEEEVVFGMTRACRPRGLPGADEIVGLFINTLPLRVAVPPDAALLPWLAELRARWMALREHEHTPLARVQSWSVLGAGRALFESLVVFEHRELGAAHAGAGEPRAVQLHEQTNFALTLAAYGGPQLTLKLGFDRRRFDHATAERILGHLRTLLGAIAANPHQCLRELPLLTAEEHRQLRDWNPPATGVAPTATLHELFAQQATRTPDAIALVFGEAQLTYAELDARSSQVAAHLRALGVGPEVIVGLRIERSPELIIALLAILKAGGAYLPIDLATPPDRAAFMLEDARAPILLTHSDLTAPAISARVICIDQLAAPAHLSPLTSQLSPSPAALAYVIYTSGSTGQPKGCCLTHANAVRLFTATDAWFRFGPADVWTLFHSIAFDFSVWEIWGALLHGGRLVIVPQSTARDPHAFLALLTREKVTVLNQTPSAFRQLSAAEESTSHLPPLTSHLRLTIFGGEALDLASLRPWFARHGDQCPQLVNMYGITETTVHVTYRPLRASDASGPSDIGIPLPDLELHILDSWLRPVPIGVPGEIFVAGAGVARGYLHRPELTAERFISTPSALSTLNSQPSTSPLYRTGDLARRLPDGDIEYLGRIDEQVKIRGFRIEPAEIAAALQQHPAVREAAVLARPTASGEQRLVAYFVARGESAEPAELRAHLRRLLPEYMVPAAFVLLGSLPLTGNGKLDRRALPVPAPEPIAGDSAAPATALEQTIAGIWQRTLGIERASLDQSFFDLGGHSLLAVQVHGSLRASLGMELPMTALFQYPTIRALARHLSEATSTPARSSSRERADLQRAAIQQRRDFARTHGV